MLKDENVRLKTKIQQMQGEQLRNEKDLETLMCTLQADKNGHPKTPSFYFMNIILNMNKGMTHSELY